MRTLSFRSCLTSANQIPLSDKARQRAVLDDRQATNVVRQQLAHNISGLPVVQDGTLAGLVTEGDLVRRSETGTERKRPHWLEFLVGAGRAADEYVHAHGRKVEEVMTTK